MSMHLMQCKGPEGLQLTGFDLFILQCIYTPYNLTILAPSEKLIENT